MEFTIKKTPYLLELRDGRIRFKAAYRKPFDDFSTHVKGCTVSFVCVGSITLVALQDRCTAASDIVVYIGGPSTRDVDVTDEVNIRSSQRHQHLSIEEFFNILTDAMVYAEEHIAFLE